MLGWRPGLAWKVKYVNRVPSLAAMMDPPDEVVEEVVGYEVVGEEEGFWKVRVKLGEGYDLFFFKEPLALHKVLHHYTSRATKPPGKLMWETVCEQEGPKDLILGLHSGLLPFIIDFPRLELERTLEDGETLDLNLRTEHMRTEFVFEGGLPFWKKATRIQGEDHIRSEGFLMTDTVTG